MLSHFIIWLDSQVSILEYLLQSPGLRFEGQRVWSKGEIDKWSLLLSDVIHFVGSQEIDFTADSFTIPFENTESPL